MKTKTCTVYSIKEILLRQIEIFEKENKRFYDSIAIDIVRLYCRNKNEKRKNNYK
jgi:hypothetical protein